MQGELVSDDYYNIVELERKDKVFVTYDTMAAAIKAENRLNHMLFWGINFFVIFGFLYLFIQSIEDDEQLDQD